MNNIWLTDVLKRQALESATISLLSSEAEASVDIWLMIYLPSLFPLYFVTFCFYYYTNFSATAKCIISLCYLIPP